MELLELGEPASTCFTNQPILKNGKLLKVDSRATVTPEAAAALGSRGSAPRGVFLEAVEGVTPRSGQVRFTFSS